jgi:hypothetical protein
VITVQTALFIAILLICLSIIILPAIAVQIVEAPRTPSTNSNYDSIIVQTDGFVAPQDPGSGGGGQGVI